MGTVNSTSSPQVGPDFFSQLLTTVAGGERRMTVEDADGRRFVLVSEERYRALEELEQRTGGRTAAPRTPTLTTREREILQLTADGNPGAVVAERLGLAPNTVAQHLASVRRKYGVRSSAAAAAMARQAGVLD